MQNVVPAGAPSTVLGMLIPGRIGTPVQASAADGVVPVDAQSVPMTQRPARPLREMRFVNMTRPLLSFVRQPRYRQGPWTRTHPGGGSAAQGRGPRPGDATG